MSSMTTNDRLKRLLDSLAGQMPGKRAARSDALQRAALGFDMVERLPIIMSFPREESSSFPPLPASTLYTDPEAMLYNELVSAWDLSIEGRESFGDDLCPTIRPNWGTVLVASILGGKVEQRDENTPWIRRDEEHPQTLEGIADADPDPAAAGWMPRALETCDAYREILAPWPELSRDLRITLPDLQGPLDTVEQLLGEDLFIDMIERPELVERALRRVAELQVACARLFAPLTNDGPEGFIHQHGFLVKGNILIRDDSVVMISPDLYRDVVAAADEFVLSSLGGGGLHSCGRIGHALPVMLGLGSIQCFDFGQSFMNDVDALYLLARERRIPFLRVQPDRSDLEDGRILERFPTGVSLSVSAKSRDEAQRLFDMYLSGCARKGARS